MSESTSDELILRLYRARLARAKAKKEFAESWDNIGTCQRVFAPDGEMRPACYRYIESELSVDEWCDTCRARQPLYDAKKQSSIEVGIAMRAVLRRGKLLDDVGEF